MIERNVEKEVTEALEFQSSVAIIGPRQVGKTTLAKKIAKSRSSVYLDLEDDESLEKLRDPKWFLSQHLDKLVILDEIHRVPGLFRTLRGLIDQARQGGRRDGLYLFLGSASMDLLKQSGESLAGRIAYVGMTPLMAFEVEPDAEIRQRLWLRGGFPDSFLATSDARSYSLRRDLIRTYLERDIPEFGMQVPAALLNRLWVMLAHNQGQCLNASRLASGLDVSATSIKRYVDLLVDLMLVRRLEPLVENVGKRLVKSPKVYIRDSGLVHALLRLETIDDLMGHPVSGASWESFVIETLLAAVPEARASFYRTAKGAEADLVLDFGGRRGRWIIEIKSGLTPKLPESLFRVQEDLHPDRTFLVYAGDDSFQASENIEVASLPAMVAQLRGEG